jgi:hypothetical protein
LHCKSLHKKRDASKAADAIHHIGKGCKHHKQEL